MKTGWHAGARLPHQLHGRAELRDHGAGRVRAEHVEEGAVDKVTSVTDANYPWLD